MFLFSILWEGSVYGMLRYVRLLYWCYELTSNLKKKKKGKQKRFSWPLLFFVGSVVNELKHLSSFQMIFVIEFLQFLFCYFVRCKIIENSKDFECLACKCSDLPQMPVVSLFSRVIYHGGRKFGTTLGLVCARFLPYNYKCPGYHLLHTIHMWPARGPTWAHVSWTWQFPTNAFYESLCQFLLSIV